MKQNKFVGLTLGALCLAAAPVSAWACACGCTIFDVATQSMFPSDAGGMAYVNYNYQDQRQNWSDTSTAPAANNADKEIETRAINLGVLYMFNRSWGAQVDVPIWNRTFKTDLNEGTPPPDVAERTWTGLGDIRLKALYTGLQDDLSTGFSVGVKLPTGRITANEAVVDRDTQIGTGSTDLLFGAFHRGNFSETSEWHWFAQMEADLPVLIQDDYRPGPELDGAVGLYYSGWKVGRVHVSPVGQLIGALRASDGGQNAAAGDSGYQRLLVSPGVEFKMHPFRLYTDIEVPVLENVNGNQLTSPFLLKVSLSYMF